MSASPLTVAALVLTSLILIPSGAHVFELPSKMMLDRDDYFVVQRIYAGWAWLAVPIFAAVLTHGAAAMLERRRNPSAALWSGVAAGLILLSLGAFFALVLPANQETSNWTRPPADWRMLRMQWEYGHAAGALIISAAFMASIRALVCRPPAPSL